MVISTPFVTFNNSNYSAAFTGFRPSVRFTLASRADLNPTVTAGRLGVTVDKSLSGVYLLITSKKNLKSGKGKTHSVFFRLNRLKSETNATFVAENWPKELRKPKVGSAVDFSVLKIQLV